MYLADTNIFIEVLLQQQKYKEAKQFLDNIPSGKLYLTEFSLYSIGILLTRQKRYDDFIRFIKDIALNPGIRVIRLSGKELEAISNFTQKFNLDFDDAYQYTVAEKLNLTIVSFDKDFDKTDRGRKLPAEIINP